MLSLRIYFRMRFPSTFTVSRLSGKQVAFSSFLKKKPIDLRLIAAVTFLFDCLFVRRLRHLPLHLERASQRSCRTGLTG